MRTLENSRENNFTFIRIIAASLVIYYHSYTTKLRIDPLSNLLGFDNSGSFAVATFFAVSGYLVTSSLLRSKTIFNYLKKRILRIYPAYFVLLLITIFVIGPMVSSFRLNIYYAKLNFLNTIDHFFVFKWNLILPGVFQNNPKRNFINGSLWSLPLEIIAYLLILILSQLRILKPKLLIFVLILMLIFYYFINNYINLNDFVILNINYIRLNKFLIFFLTGSLLYLLKDAIKISYGYLFLACLILLICRVLVFYNKSFYLSQLLELNYFFVWPYILICVAYLPIPYVKKIDEIADISYGMYLYAYPIQQTIISLKENISSFEIFLFSLILSMIIGILSWIFIEKPALRLKNKDIVFNFIKIGRRKEQL